MYGEDEYLPISGLQHLAFCPRQCALIHLERVWHENELTASGRVMHDRVHNGPAESRGPVRTVRGLPLCSSHLGLTGMADAVEFHRLEESQPGGILLPKRRGRWFVYPVEYKHGQPKKGNCDAVQLCAQAICLEEMLNTAIPEGALFYGKTRRRTTIMFTDELRKQTEHLALGFHDLMDSGMTPPATTRPCCKSCSLSDSCLPNLRSSAAHYIDSHLKEDS